MFTTDEEDRVLSAVLDELFMLLSEFQFFKEIKCGFSTDASGQKLFPHPGFFGYLPGDGLDPFDFQSLQLFHDCMLVLEDKYHFRVGMPNVGFSQQRGSRKFCIQKLNGQWSCPTNAYFFEKPSIEGWPF